MKINRLTLENFKNYDEESFSFSPGTISICGPNGSGKTSIIEAISWVLFDFIPFKKDIVNNLNINHLTASKNVAKVQVTFLSDLDSKEYVVYRNSKGNYFVIDKITTERVAEKKIEVLEFLKKHYNLSVSANLGDIFKHTIGVPQGMLTSIFLESPTERQKVFDKVLNIEDYRKAYDELKDFKQYLKDLINERQNSINILKLYVEKIPEIEELIEKINIEIRQNDLNINSLNTIITNLRDKLTVYENLEKKFIETTANLDKLKLSLSHLKKNIDESKILYNSCQEALKELNTIKPHYKKYINIKNKVSALENKKKELEKLQKSLLDEEKLLQNIEFEIKEYNSKLEANESIKNQIKELGPLVINQENLEIERKEVENLLNSFKENKSNIGRLQKEYTELNERLSFLNKELSKLDELKALSESYPEINDKHTGLNNNITELQSNLSEHQKMALQIKGGLCPFLNEACKNIEEGQDLDTYFKSKIKLYENSIINLKIELEGLNNQFKKVKLACEEFNKLSLKQGEKQLLTNKLSKVNQDILNTDKLLQDLDYVPDKVDQIIKECKLLGSPKDKLAILNKQLQDESTLLSNIKEKEKNKSKINSNIKQFKDSISLVNFDENEFINLKNEINQLESMYQNYIKLEERSKKLNDYEIHLQTLISEEKTFIEAISKSEKELQELNKTYNQTDHKDIKLQLEEKQIKKAQLEVQQKNIQQNKDQQEKQLTEAQKQKDLLKSEEEKLEEITSINNFIDISRDIFRNCGPKIGQYYIENISAEANRLYKDITMNENQELIWTMDYEIIIEENGVKRSFVNLSGGEQMSAALAVRLSLLRELSDINIAFFDEPTANMDETRRLNLAEQIKNIKSFDQLFIISHDDTFEKDIDHVIRLG